MASPETHPAIILRRSQVIKVFWFFFSKKNCLTLILAIFLSYTLLFFKFTLTAPDAYPFGDFFAIWSYPRLAMGHGVFLLYDAGALHAAQIGLGMPGGEQNPFAYPPHALFLLWPLGFLPYWPALFAWLVIGFSVFAWAMIGLRAAPWPLAFVALVAPTSTVAAVAGQSGFLTSALLLGGMRLIDRRPALAGVLLGVLTIKPQLGVLVPVALLAAGAWRCLGAAALTFVVLAVAASLAFGVGIWAAWLSALPGYVALYDGATGLLKTMPTVVADLRRLGVSGFGADIGQLVVGLVAAWCVWVSFRRGDRGVAIAVLVAATLLATPHDYVYDLPMLAGAVLVLVGIRLRADGMTPWDIAVMLATLIFPALLMVPAFDWPVASAVLGAMLWTLMRARTGTKAA